MVDADYTKPSGFDAYWDAVLAELDATPAEPEVEVIPLRETDFATLYGVQITSIGPYRLFGYLSVPRATARIPLYTGRPSTPACLR